MNQYPVVDINPFCLFIVIIELKVDRLAPSAGEDKNLQSWKKSDLER